MLEFIWSLVTNVPLILASLLAFLIAYYFIRRPDETQNYPPMPRRPLPILGHAPFLRPSPPVALLAWKKQKGDIFSFYLGSELYVCLSSYGVLKEALVKQADFFSERPTSFTKRLIEGKLDCLAGPEWKEHRSVTLSILRSLGMGRNSLAVNIAQEVQRYLHVLSATKGDVDDMKVLTNSAVANVICAMVFGKRFEYGDRGFMKLLNLMSETMRHLQTASVIGVFPWLEYLPGDIFGMKRMRQISKETEAFCQEYIDAMKNDIDDSTNDCYIKAFLREARQKERADKKTDLNETSLLHMVGTLFFTGSETTSSAIQWAMIYAMNFPHFQKQMREEIHREVGLERVPTLEDKVKLNYLNAFLAETLRTSSIAPLGTPHLCTQTTTVGGHVIPGGAVIFPHLDAIFKDEALWTNALAFDPSRFLDQDGKFITPEYFVPFSIGRRNCLGESLARMEQFLFLSAMFQRFEVVPEDPNHLPTTEPDLGLGYIPRPFKFSLIETR